MGRAMPRSCSRFALAAASALLLAACKPAAAPLPAYASDPTPQLSEANAYGPIAFAGEPAPDVDAMAARMKTDVDTYQKIRDEALAEYARRNPNPAPYDDRVKAVIRLYACLWTWSDFYGECLGARGTALAVEAQRMGCRDPILQAFLDSWEWSNYYTPTEEDAEALNQRTDDFLATGYPAALKLYACETMLDDMAEFKDDVKPSADSAAMQTREHFVEAWGSNYRELIKQHVSQTLLFMKGEHVGYITQSDEPILDDLVAEQERDFNETDPHNPLRLEMDASFYVNDAWNARGADTADTVTSQGWDYFGQRLQRAKAILDPLYNYYPQEIGTCLVMLEVSLDDGGTRYDMEKWFDRAMKIDPDSYEACQRKVWYLQPRWDGSQAEAVAFGRECAKGGNWESKIPMILGKAYSGVGDSAPAIYADTSNWSELGPLYREYLKRYPDAVNYRTCFAFHAYNGGHFDTALEEFKILGNDWDRTVIDDDKYKKIRAQLKLP